VAGLILHGVKDGVPGIRILAACHCQVPGHSCHSEHICEKCCHLAHRGQNMGEAGMIRFVKMAIFPGVQQLFFIRRAITSGTFNH
jgi:hypothetical protein